MTVNISVYFAGYTSTIMVGGVPTHCPGITKEYPNNAPLPRAVERVTIGNYDGRVDTVHHRIMNDEVVLITINCSKL